MKLRTFTIIALTWVIAVGAMAQGKVTIKEGSVDADKWTIAEGQTEVTPGTTAVTEGNIVNLNYTGAKRVKSVRVIMQVPPASVMYMKWDADQKTLVEAATLGVVYKVAASNNAVSWSTGTYMVDENVTINGDITVNGDVNLIVCDDCTLTVNGQIKDGTARTHDLNIYGQSEQTGQIVVTSASGSAFVALRSLNFHGGQFMAVSTFAGAGGVSNVKQLNVYAGTFTAKNTNSGYGVLLYDSGSKLNVHSGTVTVEGKGSGYAGIQSNAGQEASITIYDGRFFASNPDAKALNRVAIRKGAAYEGIICDSDDNGSWTALTGTSSDRKYVKAELLTDLSSIDKDYIVKNGETLIGTLDADVKISIADGATVTLSGVNINVDGDYTDGEYAGLNCLGDATIIIAEGSTNIVRGFYEDYPGIHVPERKTLTIKGEGTLTVSPYDGGGTEDSYGAGIGGGYELSCGNIRIEGGTINATGGNSAAGIGGGQSMDGESGSCGDITIVGGTVNAIGGMYAAGIGSGNGGSCGIITISKTVTKVTATAGEDASNSIGAGEGGSCTEVKIESGANVIEN